MRRRFHAFLLPLALAALTLPSFAAADDDEVHPDARLEGYTKSGSQPGTGGAPLVITPSSGTATTWIMIAILGGASLGAMCKSGQRTHLD